MEGYILKTQSFKFKIGIKYNDDNNNNNVHLWLCILFF